VQENPEENGAGSHQIEGLIEDFSLHTRANAEYPGSSRSEADAGAEPGADFS
jgi:hypothetical protein